MEKKLTDDVVPSESSEEEKVSDNHKILVSYYRPQARALLNSIIASIMGKNKDTACSAGSNAFVLGAHGAAVQDRKNKRLIN